MENNENMENSELVSLSETELCENADEEKLILEEEYVPKNSFERVLYSVYKNDTLNPILHVLSYVIVGITAYAFIWRAVNLVVSDIWQAVWLLLITGVPFAVVSVIRRLINAPRPYELFEFYREKPKGKTGQSFPSRHVFSITVTGIALMPWSLLVGIGLLVLGAALALIRVLLGIHFIRDVVAGALIGVISGAIGLLLYYII